VSVRVEQPPATPPADLRTLIGRNPLSGATVVNVSPASAQQYGADPFSAQGVLVTQTDGGYAQTIGVHAGDFIREVNGQKVATTAELAAALQAPTRTWTIVIQRAGQIITARFGA
jgi:S1-C subfamily serine protease